MRYTRIAAVAVIPLLFLLGCTEISRSTDVSSKIAEAPTETIDHAVSVPSDNESDAVNAGAKAAFDELVLADDEICYIVLSDYEPQNSLGAGFHIVVENRGEHTLLVNARTMVNGSVYYYPDWAGQETGDYYLIAEAGEAVSSFLFWKQEELSAGDIESAELTLGVYETDGTVDYSRNYYDCVLIEQNS